MKKTYVYNTGNYSDPKDELEIEVGVFFDGTLNNLKNTEFRQKYKDRENKMESTDTDEEILRKEKAIEASTKAQEKEYKKLKNKDNPDVGNEYEQYLKAIHRSYMDKMGVDNSFSNDFTNVARLYKCCEQDYYAIYVEGIGTLDNRRDVDDGFQYGSGKTGVRGKVRLGCEKLADRIKKIKRSLNKPKVKLTKITVDTFGFSRGAAAARNFSYEINGKKRPEDIQIKKTQKLVGYRNSVSYANDMVVRIYEDIWIDKDGIEVEPEFLIDGKLPKYGFLGYYLLSKDILSLQELDELELKVRFIGVYDTVSSYEEFDDMDALERIGVRGLVHSTMGSSHYFGNDVEQLQLKNPGPYSRAVHFTAMDEHRQNFSLTSFPGSIEKELPGVHADIGGAYENGTEIVDEIETSNNKLSWFLEKRRQELIDQYWYNDEQIEIKKGFLNVITLGSVYRKITGTRFLRKEYSYIPLQFMEELGEKYFKHQLISEIESTFSIDEDEYLRLAKRYLYEYVCENEGAPWYFKSDEVLEQEKRLKQILEENQNKDKNELLKEKITVVPDNLRINIKPIPIEISPKVSFPIEKKEEPFDLQNVDEKGDEIVTLEELVIETYSRQKLLRILRNRYLHWSANRDWADMDPNNDYKRKIY